MLIVEFDGLPSWSIDASKTGESGNCLWVGVVKGTVGAKKQGDCNSFTQSCVKGVWPIFDTSTDQIN